MPFTLKAALKEVQDISFLAVRAFLGAFKRPLYFRDILIQMDQIGVGSLSVIMLTGFSIGAILTLQSAKTLSVFGAVGSTGTLVSVALVRELPPCSLP
jgi:phospholipid/cholesterol/gamma-HCH transport system permease protein